MARHGLRRAAENPLVGQFVGLVERTRYTSRDLLRVLTYHDLDRGEPFERQAEHLARHHACVSIADVLAAVRGDKVLPPSAVLITFDDAYRSFLEIAWPILRARGLPAVLFVPTAYPDSALPAFWWDRLRNAFEAPTSEELTLGPIGTLSLRTPQERAGAYQRVRRHARTLSLADAAALTDRVCRDLGAAPLAHDVLGWDELRRLADEGATLGAHTRTHPLLDRMPRDEARAEIEGSLDDLDREVGGASRVLAYPDGRHDDAVVDLTRAAGVELAFSTQRGTNDLRRADRLRLRRIHVDGGDSVAVLRAKLAYSSVGLNGWRRLFGRPRRPAT